MSYIFRDWDICSLQPDALLVLFRWFSSGAINALLRLLFMIAAIVYRYGLIAELMSNTNVTHHAITSGGSVITPA